MRDVKIEKMSGDAPRKDRRFRRTVFGGRGSFCFLLLILTPILLLPFTLPAEDLTCSHLPVLLENLQASH